MRYQAGAWVTSMWVLGLGNEGEEIGAWKRGKIGMGSSFLIPSFSSLPIPKLVKVLNKENS